jgi:hypothetical protein
VILAGTALLDGKAILDGTTLLDGSALLDGKTRARQIRTKLAIPFQLRFFFALALRTLTT